jgi:hypothetical protein
MTNYYCFDFCGVYLGYIDDTRSLYDPHGMRWARLDEEGRIFDADGRYRGYVDAQGSFFGENGAARGYVRGWTAATAAIPEEPWRGTSRGVVSRGC